MFKPGDKVRCIDNSGGGVHLTRGKEYEVLEGSDGNIYHTKVEDDSQKRLFYFQDRFELVSELVFQRHDKICLTSPHPFHAPYSYVVISDIYSNDKLLLIPPGGIIPPLAVRALQRMVYETQAFSPDLFEKVDKEDAFIKELSSLFPNWKSSENPHNSFDQH